MLPQMFRTILVPLDGSAESNVALPLARALVKSTAGSIWLLRVARESALPGEHGPTHDAAFSIERIAKELASSGTDVHPVIREGDASQEILHLSSEIAADVIVMRTHGRAGLERAVFGSVTEQVLEKTKIPLLVLRPGGRRASNIQRLLVPVDGSPGGAVALQTAVQVARTTGASIDLVQVVVPVPMLAFAAPYDYSGAAFYDPVWDDDALLAARTYVEAVAERLRKIGVVVNSEARIAPNVAGAIVDAAEHDSTDMIVMSTHALTGPARALLGSVADAVVRISHCPVLLVKRTAGDQPESAMPGIQSASRLKSDSDLEVSHP
jgi:nucleotide-binding universal stress UspA family protein